MRFASAAARIDRIDRIDRTWLILSGLTVLAWAASELSMPEHGAATGNGVEAVAVLGIAGLKARLIAGDYMELRTAPACLRRLVDGWLVGLLLTLVAIHAFG